MTAGTWVTIAVFLTAQTGALIYYAGVLSSTVRAHESRIDKVESKQEKLIETVGELTGWRQAQ